MDFPTIRHHGAANTVTGSCHQLDLSPTTSFLIDCGLFQGFDADIFDGSPLQEIDFPAKDIKALILTHAHIDHVGRIPNLLASGFKGPILCSEPSAKLLPLVLEDAFRLGISRDEKKLERYLKIISQRVIALPFDTWFPLITNPDLVCRIRLQRAGHILGSSYIEIDISYLPEKIEKRLVFSGDLGSAYTPMLPQPKSPERADILVLESTYGDKRHEDRSTRQARLEAVIDKALIDHGTILIPAFSMGRTQELLYEIEDILYRKALMQPHLDMSVSDSRGLPINWPQLPILLDSPLAKRFTKIYREHNHVWVHEAQQRLADGRKPLAFEQLITIDSHEQHMQTVNYLRSTGRPAIVIAGSGMCSNGRIVNYLKAMLGDSRHNVVFVGYQAKGTIGAVIQEHGPKGGYVKIDNERYPIKAGVETIGGYSAHADQAELLNFVAGIPSWPDEIRLVHGEAKAKESLRRVLRGSSTKKCGVAMTILVP